jgi:hypothetical protein
MRWVGHVARMGKERNAYRLLVGKRLLGRPRRRWVANVKLDLGEVGWGDVDWIGLAQDRNRWRAFVNSVLSLWVPWHAGRFSSGGTMGVVSIELVCSSSQSCWLQIQRSRVLFPALPDFLGSIGFGTGPLSLVSTTEELLGRKSNGSGLECREYGRRVPSRWPRGTLYPQNLSLNSLRSGGRSWVFQLVLNKCYITVLILWGCFKKCIYFTNLLIQWNRDFENAFQHLQIEGFSGEALSRDVKFSNVPVECLPWISTRHTVRSGTRLSRGHVSGRVPRALRSASVRSVSLRAVDAPTTHVCCLSASDAFPPSLRGRGHTP